MMRRGVLTLASLLARTLVVGSAVGARRRRATRGDAQALLNAFGNGGWAVINHDRVARARRGPANRTIQIRPFDFFNDRHYCELDWHTIVLADIEGGARPYPRQQAEAIIADLRVELALDGTPLALSQTPVIKFNNAQLFVIEPSDLAVGQHTLRGLMTNASGSDVYFDNTINFFIDAVGTGACG